jgi:hypothetical protein
MENKKTRSTWVERMIHDEWELEKARIKNYMIIKLTQSYPNTKFHDLQKLNNECITNNGCIYYKTKNNIIYSWNCNLSEWHKVNNVNSM